MKFLSSKLDLRLYQQTILGTASLHNTLVVIPTGLGKTFVAIGLAGLVGEGKKVLMLAPTKPLCVQHYKTFSRFFDAEDGELVVMTGAVAPAERKKLWAEGKVFFATPQTVENDLMRRFIDPAEYGLVVFDEAHRAVGDYAYVWIAKQFAKSNGANNTVKKVRILALTASPASEKEKLDEVCNNLFIQKVEVRNTSDADVVPYIQGKNIEKIDVEFPEKLNKVKIILEGVLKQRLLVLKRNDVIASAEPGKVRKVELLRLQGTLASRTDVDKDAYLHISLVAECLKLQHALLLLQTQGVSPLVDFFKKLEKQAPKTKASKRLVNDWMFKKAMILAYEFRGEEGEHPKFGVLREIVNRHEGEKFIVFAQYRSSVKKIVEELEGIDWVVPAAFIGQSKGMSQKEQVATVEKFRAGEVNALVTTTVGEEGIDIPAVPFGVFFEPVPSALRMIQRAGRIGRTELGKVYLLVTKGTIDEKYYWVAKHKEARMNQLLDDLKAGLEDKQSQLGDF